MPLSNFGEE